MSSRMDNGTNMTIDNGSQEVEEDGTDFGSNDPGTYM